MKELRGGSFRFVSGVVVMRKFQMPWQLCAAAIGGLLAAGCGSFSENFGSGGVGIPSTSAIANYYSETGQQALIADSKERLTVEQYLITSLTFTNVKCHGFFEKLEEFRQDRDFIDQIITAAIAAGSPWLALTNSAKTVARITSILSVGNQLNKESADIYAFYAFRKSLKRHVFQGLADFQTKKGLDLLVQSRYGLKMQVLYPDSNDHNVARIQLNADSKLSIDVNVVQLRAFLSSKQTEDLLIAQTIATDYAVICSLENLRRIVEDSLDSSSTTALADPNPASPTVTKTASPDAAAKSSAERAALVAVAAASDANAAKAGASEAKNEAKAAKSEAAAAQSVAADAANVATQAAENAKRAAGP